MLKDIQILVIRILVIRILGYPITLKLRSNKFEGTNM